MPPNPRHDAESTVVLSSLQGRRRMRWRQVVDEQCVFVERPRSTDRNRWSVRNR